MYLVDLLALLLCCILHLAASKQARNVPCRSQQPVSLLQLLTAMKQELYRARLALKDALPAKGGLRLQHSSAWR